MTGTVSCVRWLNYVINKQELVAPILHRYGETGIAPEQGFEAFSITRTDLESGFTQLGIDDFTCQYLNAFMVALPADGGPVDGLPNQQPVPAINWWRALNRLLELCHPIFMREMFARKEFHPAWKPSNLGFWPSNPIQDPEQLKEYTESVIALAVAAEYPLSAAQREIENITLAAFQIVPGAIGWPSIGKPSNMVEAIQSLHGLASRILIDEPELPALEQPSLEPEPETGLKTSTWPTGSGWEFRPGQAAFRGVCFDITGKNALALQKLAEKPGEPVLKETLLDLLDPDHIAPNCASDAMSDIRRILKGRFSLECDPIPTTKKPTSWKLVESIFPNSAESKIDPR